MPCINKLIPLGIALLFSILLYSCTEKFFPEIKATNSILVVDGKITNKSGPYEVKLFKTVDVDSNDSLFPESNAIITINCSDGSTNLLLENEPGIYLTQDSEFVGEIGKSYWVEIITSDSHKYESIPEEIQSEIQIKSIYGEEDEVVVDIDEKRQAVKFYFDIENPENNSSYYVWNYRESWEWHVLRQIPKSEDPAYICYPTNNPSKVNLFDASILTEKKINHLPLSTIDENEVKLLHSYYLTVDAYTVSKTCFNFWQNIKKISQSDGSLFDVIPSSVFGNIQSCDDDTEVLGYFQVSSHSTYGNLFTEDSYNIEFPIQARECNVFELVGDSYVPGKYHYIKERIDDSGERIYTVQNNFCYDCSLKYPSNKPSFWF